MNYFSSSAAASAGGGAEGASTINGVTQNRLACDSMSTAGEAGDTSALWRKNKKGSLNLLLTLL